MNSKTEQLNQLFDEWEQSIDDYKGKFIRDGIIDERLFLTTNPRLLFITKEPNNPEQKAGDFRDWWSNKITHNFSYRLAEWSYGLFNNFPQFDVILKNKVIAHNAIKRVAFMNIKKNGGSGKSIYNPMIEHLEKNFSYLHQQIDIISPEIIIMGLSWKKLRNGLFPNVNWINSGYDVAIGRYKNARIVDFYHPSSRTAPAASYSLLQNIINANQFKQL